MSERDYPAKEEVRAKGDDTSPCKPLISASGGMTLPYTPFSLSFSSM
jgi:hypothetical protein